jgi:hypothetical protein
MYADRRALRLRLGRAACARRSVIALDSSYFAMQSRCMNSAIQSLSQVSSSREISEELDVIKALKGSARDQAGAVWFPLIAGGIFTLGSPTAINLIGGELAPAWYWGCAGPVIGLLCGFFYSKRRVRMPARRAGAAVGLAAAMVVVSLVVGLAFGKNSGATIPVAVVGVGYALFAWLYRSWHVAAVAIATGIGVVVMAVYRTNGAEDLTSLVVGAASCFSGLLAIATQETRNEVSR